MSTSTPQEQPPQEDSRRPIIFDKRAVPLSEMRKRMLYTFGTADQEYHRRGGYAEGLMYSTTSPGTGLPAGSALWDIFTNKHQAYYPPREDPGLIQKSLAMIGDTYGHVISVRDFGCGGPKSVRNKAYPIVEKLGAIYTPVDLSATFLNNATTAMHGLNPALVVKPVQGDFFRKRKIGKLGIPNDIPALGMLLGSTITNFEMNPGEGLPTGDIQKKLRVLAAHMTVNDNEHGHSGLVFTYDSNADMDHAAQSYKHPAWDQLVCSVMFEFYKAVQHGTRLSNGKDKKREDIGSFDPTAWEPWHEIDYRNRVIHHGAVATQSQEFRVDHHPIVVKKGEPVVIINTGKFTPTFFHEQLREVGLVPGETVISDDSHMVLQTAEVPSGYTYDTYDTYD